MPRIITARFLGGPIHDTYREIYETNVYQVPLFTPMTFAQTHVDFLASEIGPPYIIARYDRASYDFYRNAIVFDCVNQNELIEAGWHPECGTNICGPPPCPHTRTRQERLVQEMNYGLAAEEFRRAVEAETPPLLREVRDAWDAMETPDSYRMNAARESADKEIEEWDKFVAEIKAKKGTK